MPKILLIRFSSIGDIVLTSPIIRALKDQLQAELHYLTKPQFSTLVKCNPHVSKVHSLQSSLADTIKELKAEQFDYIIDLHKNLRSRRIILALGIPAYNFDKLNWEKWLIVNLRADRLPNLHLVDRYFQGLEKLGIKNDGKGLDFFFDGIDARFSIASFCDWPAQTPYLCLILGAAHTTKQMPYELLVQIIEKSPYKIALLGGTLEKETGEKLAEKFADKVCNLSGKTSLSASAKIIEKSRVVITPDTGMMHIAAALKIPIVCVWGNTIPKFGMYPYYPAGESKYINIEIVNLPCRPCSKIGKTTCPKGHFKCMKDISPEDVLNAADQWLT